MLDGQILAGLLTGKLYRRAVDDRVRTGEIDILKYARRGLALDVAVHAAQLAVFNDADLARLHVTDELCAERVERAGLGGEYIAVAVQQTDAERTEAVGVARSDQLARGHDHERIRALDALHGAQHGLLDGGALEALLDDGVDQDLGIVRGTENAAVQLDLAAQLARVYEVAVVRNGEVALDMGDGDRLCILAARVAGRRVADMADRHGTRHPVERFLVENRADQTNVLMAVDHAVFVDGDAGCLLTAVLQCEQRGVGVVCGGDFLALGRRDAEYAALLVYLVKRSAALSFNTIFHRIFSLFLSVRAAYLPMTRFMIS